MNELALTSISDIERVATVMAKSGLFNKNPEQMMALMLIAQAEGLHPAIAAQEYDVIQGRPALKGQSALARFQQAGGKVQWHTRTDAEASATFTHTAGGSLKVIWTMDRAGKAGLTGKDNWKKQPGVMLAWRCVAEGVRAVYPACLSRMYLAEEVQDIDDEPRNVTPDAAPVAMPEEKAKKLVTMKQAAPEPQPEVQAEAPLEEKADDWPTEWNQRAIALSKRVSGWPKPDRDALELGALVAAAKQDRDMMDIAEIRAEIYQANNTGPQIDAVMESIKKAGKEVKNLLQLKADLEEQKDANLDLF